MEIWRRKASWDGDQRKRFYPWGLARIRIWRIVVKINESCIQEYLFVYNTSSFISYGCEWDSFYRHISLVHIRRKLMGSLIPIHVWCCASYKSQLRFPIRLDKYEVCYKSWLEIWQLSFSLAMWIHASFQCNNHWTCCFHSSLDILKHEWHSKEFPRFGGDFSFRRIFLHNCFEERSTKWFRWRAIRRFPCNLAYYLSQCSTRRQ